MDIGRDVEYPLSSLDFNLTWILSAHFRKILKHWIPWKSVQWEPSCFMRTDWHEKAKSRFSQFYERAYKFLVPAYCKETFMICSGGPE
jgi:hypothetical protein